MALFLSCEHGSAIWYDPSLTTRSQTSDKGEDDRLLYGVSAMQGWRISMEDAHTTVLDLLPVSSRSDAEKSHPPNISFFGVFDGHGGDKVALFTGEKIHDILLKQDTFKSGEYAQSLKDTFLATDRAILNGMPTLSPTRGHAFVPDDSAARQSRGRLYKLPAAWLTFTVHRPEVRGGSLGLYSLCRPDSR